MVGEHGTPLLDVHHKVQKGRGKLKKLGFMVMNPIVQSKYSPQTNPGIRIPFQPGCHASLSVSTMGLFFRPRVSGF